LPHCATWGARHVTSQRLPFISALHMLPFLPTIEFVTVLLVPPTSIELVTLDELFEVIELLTLEEVRESIELEVPADTTPCAHP
jgi:hypothetical protein